ncbi:NAD(P)H-binding protein [Antrihabitans sp. YC3-6]|uniref:NAD(P)H-binding protein n=1 Tax=Antrihabitans stalagmiti TaxID=2799499 RepID=A0A934NRU7_9NOCA|nr:NAD(P)H-binding protein [Antrihabitans stalagmiti]MBJ8340314.1 NAD(P)H-binding protein [Antrihabitans stalagmiti]
MKVILFGATGMVGQGVLRECLLDPRVTEVLAVGRTPLQRNDPKLTELIHSDLLNLESIEDRLTGYDACLFCLGTSSVGMDEADYTRVTYDYTMSVGRTLARLNPDSTFVYVSGAGTDSTEQGRSMWARVKGRTENELLALPFSAYMFRPGIIQPLHGVQSKTRLYRTAYTAATPLFFVLKRVAPNLVVTTDQIGAAMLAVAANGTDKRVLESGDIRAASRQ